MSDKSEDKARRGRHAAVSKSKDASPAPTGGAPSAVAEEVPSADGAAAYASMGSMLPIDVEAEAKRGRKPLKVLGIALAVLLAVLAAVYAGGVILFMDRFMPNTSAGDIDLSLKTKAEARAVFSDAIGDYKLQVSGQGFSFSLSSSDAGLAFDSEAMVDGMHAEASPWAWPAEIMRAHDVSDRLAASYNENGLEEAVRIAVDQFNAEAAPPTDATIAYSEEEGAFIVVAESPGTALDCDAVMKAIDEAVISLKETVTLSAAELAKPAVLKDDPHLVAAAKQANTMIAADLDLMMAGSTAAEVGPDLVSQWIRLGDDLSATLDEDALTAWVDELAADCNTVGSERTYTRPDGKVVTVSGGVYGWEVDRDALLEIVRNGVAEGTVGAVDVPCLSTGAAFNGPGAQDWGGRYCDIDLAEQHVRFYDESGALVWESDCISGTPDGMHDTSTGVYWMNAKQSPSKLVGYENGEKIYESYVQYWMPFVDNVIGLHDADWQTSGFGGTMYRNGFGSHGCVNLPPSKAAELYGIIQEGDVVVSHW